MGWTYVDTIPGVGVGGPNPLDAFFLEIKLNDNVSVPLENVALAFGFVDNNLVPAEAVILAFSLAEETATPLDVLESLGIRFSDTVLLASDNASYAMAYSIGEQVAAQVEAKRLRITGLGDTNQTQLDGAAFTGYFWFSGTTGSSGNTTNPSNANSVNDGALAEAKTVLLGATTAELKARCGANIPNGTLYSEAKLRLWFRGPAFPASQKQIKVVSDTGLFSNILLLNSVSPEEYLNGSYTVNLLALGVNTFAKLKSVEIWFQVHDNVAGVGPEIQVDAGRIELTGIMV